MTSKNKELENQAKDDGKNWPQILAILVASLGPLSTGLLFSWSSPFSVVITTDKQNYDISEEEASYFIILHPIGMLSTTIVLFFLGEFLGTKKTFWLMGIPHSLSWFLTIFAKSKWDFYIPRLLAGVGDAFYFASGPSYIGEVSNPTVRGYFGNIPAIAVNLGLLLITVLGSHLGVATTAYICIGIPLSLLILMWFLPESPYQQFKDGNYEGVKKSLQWLTRKSDVEEEFLMLTADMQRQLSENGTFKDLFIVKSNQRALRAALLLRWSQQFSGIAVFTNYTQIIFSLSGSNLSPQNSSIIFIGTYCFLTLSCSPAIERFGRRVTCFTSTLCCGVFLLIMSVYFSLDQFDVVDLSKMKWIPLAGMMLYVAFFAPGMGIIPTLMLGELFSSSIKSKAMCVMLLFFGIVQLLSSNIFTQLNTHVGLYAPFLIYGVSCISSSFLVMKWVPETKGKTLEEIQQDLKKM